MLSGRGDRPIDDSLSLKELGDKYELNSQQQRTSVTLLIGIERLPNGEFAAIDDRDDDLGWPVGEGKAPAEAVADFAMQMQERGLLDK